MLRFPFLLSGKLDAIHKEIDLQIADGNHVTIDSCAPRTDQLESLDDTTEEKLKSITKHCTPKTCCLNLHSPKRRDMGDVQPRESSEDQLE